MQDKEIKKMILKWADKVGAHNVMATLIQRRLSVSLVEKLIGGRYPGTLRGASREIIETELSKAGFPVHGIKAS